MSNKATVQSGQRMLAILDFMAQSTEAVSIKEISEALDLPPSTVHRLLATLAAGRLVEQDRDRRYSLGVKLIALGHVAQERLDLRSVALDTMRELAKQTHLEVNLAQLDQSDVLYLEKVADGAPFSLNIRVGQRRPAYCRALGKVLLAYLSPEEARRRIGSKLPRMTPQTITDPDALMEHLAGVRQRGYAVDREEAESGCVCVAAPIRDARGEVVAALSISGPSGQMAAMPEAHIARIVQDAADAIASRLGYEIPVR